jgi:biofilm PGA synthesis N-glycosyltransferase PgaC
LDTPFIWYNFVFPYIDVVFLFIFVPGVIAALFFNWYLLASIITIYLLPLALINNSIIYFIQKKTLKELNIKMPNKNWFGFILYMLFFQLIMTPATLSGYVSEILKRKRVW